MEGAVLQDVRSSLKECTSKVRSASVEDDGAGGDAEVVHVAVTTIEGGRLRVKASEQGYHLLEYSNEDGTSVAMRKEEDVEFESLHALLSHHSKAYRESFAGELGDALSALGALQGSRRSSSSASGEEGGYS
uniref:GSKIP domain-containing protein n=1 Tax=Hemiselmis andersenii TaxID=464988 RepID=A0A6T8IGW4_HEMAN|mmetsp:Transcript_44744/g.109216  ORF Transcript_44744/g.109216 Transcript_44744/m.109216 type:complete len:132 (+) Transcript_44744:268-663(+)